MEKRKFDLAVIGSGPGGYVAAIRAAQRGLSTCLIEAKESGGTCLNRGCIPSKALIAGAAFLRKIEAAKQHGIYVKDVSLDYSTMATRKDYVVDGIRKNLEALIKKNDITLLQGFGKFLSPHRIKVMGKDDCEIEAGQIIIATGSEPRELPSVPIDHMSIHDSTSLLNLKTLPKSLTIIGGGVIGCEFASLYNTFGVTVTIVELLPQILSTEGAQIADVMTKSFEKRGIRILTDTMITNLERKNEGMILHLNEGKNVESESILLSVGRKYNTNNIGLDKAGVIVNSNGSIDTNARMQTNVAHIYAIGDITAKWILAHVASHQGLVAADTAAGIPTQMHYHAIPSVIFTHPEVGSVGYTLEKAIQAGYQATVSSFPFQALGKAQAMGETEGFAQIVTVKGTGQILGAQVIGEGASTLIAEMALAINAELTIDSLIDTVHAHPTLAEAWLESAFLASNLPLHLPPKTKPTT